MSNSKIIVSPAGVAIYPKVNQPDTKFKPEGEYSMKLRVTSEKAAALVAEIDAAYQAKINEIAAEKKKPAKLIKLSGNKGYSPDVNDQGEETGDIIFKAAQKASYKDKSGNTIQKRIVIFDSKKQPTNANVGGGSIVKFKAEIFPWYTDALGVGVSLRLLAVQIIELKEWSGNAQSADGFEEEDGYVAEVAMTETEDTQASPTASAEAPKRDF